MFECRILGIPMDAGAGRGGCRFGPSAYRRVGLDQQLRCYGRHVEDLGDVQPRALPPAPAGPERANRLGEVLAWLSAIAPAADRAGADGAVPVFLGGDHALSAATVPAMARRAARTGRPLFVLWLDAHPDLHDMNTSETGNLHGMPVAYFTGLARFEGFPPLAHRVAPEAVLQVGLRSIDAAEHRLLARAPLRTVPFGGDAPQDCFAAIARFLEHVRAADADLHVSLDADFLDPAIAPGVGTAVPGGADAETAQAIMDLVRDSMCLTSLDLVELNPTLDEADRTARLMSALAATALGAAHVDRKTGS